MAERKDPKLTTIKALFAKSGNQCAFPDCEHPLVDDRNLFIAELCHINAVKKVDARFDSNLSAEDLRHYDNLILLCHAHHKRIDSFEDEYTVDVIRNMKSKHEAIFDSREYTAPDSAVAESSLYVMKSTWAPPLDQVLNQLQSELDTGVAMNYTAANMCFVLDAKLFYQYTELFQHLPSTKQVDLYEEQLMWRDARHTSAVTSMGEGSVATLEYSETYMNFTEERISELTKRLNEIGG